eukprot:CAMPEP_0116146178 /NCGR_PEP_ID=MMETSP0329-20121206/17024_1 /TAXON_ID=697910 /ORGANISM="Pseudo-nitzschia arenysensis, Strain B593" /LENGTH=320 /DNA_ID=CAMNT_0003641905 /DNA_START=103 /DNA_END=1065 /DNA_ORIENTATION=-
MKFQIAFIALVLSIACHSAEAYAPASMISRPSTAFVNSRIPKATTSQLFSQWDEEEEDEIAAVSTTPSYEEAEKAIGDEDDQAAMDDMGEFDASGNYNANDIDRYREAIRKRTEALGMEKKTVEEIAAEEAMASEALGQAGDSMAPPSQSPDQLSQMLDLSQITSDAPRGPDENLPAMMYDPAKDMTEEEMAEADPTGLLPWNEQIAWVFSKSKFPSALSALTETIILLVTVVVTAVVITQWDEWMRQIAFNTNMVPRPEEVASSMEGMVMPDDPVLGMGGGPSGADMLKMLQEGGKETLKAVQDGSIKDILAGDVPQDL